MIDGLISGKLHGTAQERTSKNGKQFTTAKLKAATHEGESVFINVLAFNDAAQAALLALGDGDAMAVAGSLKPTTWTDREGQPRTGLDMIAANVLTAYSIDKRRRAVTQRQPSPQDPPPRPRHDAWIARTPGRPPTQEHLDHGDLDF